MDERIRTIHWELCWEEGDVVWAARVAFPKGDGVPQAYILKDGRVVAVVSNVSTSTTDGGGGTDWPEYAAEWSAWVKAKLALEEGIARGGA